MDRRTNKLSDITKQHNRNRYVYIVDYRGIRHTYQNMITARSEAARTIKQTGETIKAYRLRVATGDMHYYGEFGKEWVEKFINGYRHKSEW